MYSPCCRCHNRQHCFRKPMAQTVWPPDRRVGPIKVRKVEENVNICTVLVDAVGIIVLTIFIMLRFWVKVAVFIFRRISAF